MMNENNYHGLKVRFLLDQERNQSLKVDRKSSLPAMKEAKNFLANNQPFTVETIVCFDNGDFYSYQLKFNQKTAKITQYNNDLNDQDQKILREIVEFLAKNGLQDGVLIYHQKNIHSQVEQKQEARRDSFQRDNIIKLKRSAANIVSSINQEPDLFWDGSYDKAASSCISVSESEFKYDVEAKDLLLGSLAKVLDNESKKAQKTLSDFCHYLSHHELKIPSSNEMIASLTAISPQTLRDVAQFHNILKHQNSIEYRKAMSCQSGNILKKLDSLDREKDLYLAVALIPMWNSFCMEKGFPTLIKSKIPFLNDKAITIDKSEISQKNKVKQSFISKVSQVLSGADRNISRQ